MTEDVLKTSLLDRHMKEVFDWSDSNVPVRDAIWNYFMEKNGKNTLKTEEDMLPFLKDSDDKIEAFVNENLKK
ncbi:hypothetical protein QP343_07555 [Lactobacillus jensenii]|jgi:hypothetical protein|uniref:Uncharacterized protein n=1 Tax=Lactobacillus jensenii TaxID=109790 RepID=A0A5N1I481_LACJE|nr:hypothetical protein [Lactobacillus jensenii]EEQ68984.1 hypothetical protein LBJG_01412 [Lactobacillus jensenii 1153]ERJ44199.1 hypothetical protein N581_07615 [Lactobacillus jensenii MD IIE-70(2)]APT14280.1 hypothetical protein BUE77_02150 [Lactobacillus jensenii]EEQ24054.1 hypothetical protein LACJE0001_1624 [Lactobacillus jensenii 269-3]EEX27363.1 hypothetical protein HMPREF0527_00995 [Lactobacillus jensenii SJ-7A-US]